MCKRALRESAAPGLAIGPKCAKDRGLLPGRVQRVRLFDIRRSNHIDEAQLDWVDLLARPHSPGPAPEEFPLMNTQQGTAHA